MSNESYADFLVRMIETSDHGSLMGTFISSALEKASRTTVVATYEELGGHGAFIDPVVWQDVARELFTAIRYRNTVHRGGQSPSESVVRLHDTPEHAFQGHIGFQRIEDDTPAIQSGGQVVGFSAYQRIEDEAND